MATRDESGRAARHEDEVKSLTAQISFLDEEIAVLRRRLADSPRQVRLLEERLRETEASLTGVTAQNERLAATLREARDQIVALKEEVDRLAQPPSGFGVFLSANDDDTVRRLHRRPQDAGERVARPSSSPSCARARKSCSTRRSTSSSPSRTRRWARSSCSRRSSPTATARWSSPTPTRSGWSGWPSRCCTSTLRAGDSLLLEPRSGYVVRADPQGRGRGAHPRGSAGHRLPRDRRPGRPDRADPGRRRAALPARRPVQGAPAQAAEGRPAVRPARLRQDADRQGGGELAGQEGRGQDGTGRGPGPRRARASSSTSRAPSC